MDRGVGIGGGRASTKDDTQTKHTAGLKGPRKGRRGAQQSGVAKYIGARQGEGRPATGGWRAVGG